MVANTRDPKIKPRNLRFRAKLSRARHLILHNSAGCMLDYYQREQKMTGFKGQKQAVITKSAMSSCMSEANCSHCHFHITITNRNTVMWPYLLLKSLVSLSTIITVGFELNKILAGIIVLRCIMSVNCERNLSQCWYTHIIVWGSNIAPCSRAWPGSSLKLWSRGILFFMMTWHKYRVRQKMYTHLNERKLYVV